MVPVPLNPWLARIGALAGMGQSQDDADPSSSLRGGEADEAIQGHAKRPWIASLRSQ